jgi:hypothetical protein
MRNTVTNRYSFLVRLYDRKIWGQDNEKRKSCI